MNPGETWSHEETDVDWEAMGIIDDACKGHTAFGYTHTRGADAMRSQELKNVTVNVSCDNAEEETRSCESLVDIMAEKIAASSMPANQGLKSLPII